MVEERFFDLRLGESGSLIKEALEEAAGMELRELAPGMWTGTRPTTTGNYLMMTARAQAADEGTTVQLQVEHRSNPGYAALAIILLILGSVLLLPLVPMLIWLQRHLEKQQRERLVLMHKMWTELAAVVGAPKRGSYRRKPERAYVGASRIAVASGAEADAEAAAIEAAEAEAAAAEAVEPRRARRD